MNLPEHLIDLLEDTLVSGLRLQMGDADTFKREFRQDPESFLVSLILSAKKDSLPKSSTGTKFPLWRAVGGESLGEARKLIKEWEQEPATHH